MVRTREQRLLMGRITPDHGPDRLFRCEYCMTYGPPGQCQACGAPNAPDKPKHTTFPKIEFERVLR